MLPQLSGHILQAFSVIIAEFVFDWIKTKHFTNAKYTIKRILNFSLVFF